MGKTQRPSDTKLRKAFQSAVSDVFESGQLEGLTVKRIRAAVEAEFDLPQGYFKEDEEWNKKSKEIIEEESDAQYAKAEDNDNPLPDRAKPANSAPPASRPSKAPTQTRPHKRASPSEVAKKDDGPKTSKRQKISAASDSNSSDLSELSAARTPASGDDQESEIDQKPAKKAQALTKDKGPKAASKQNSNGSSVGKAKGKNAKKPEPESSSELSEISGDDSVSDDHGDEEDVKPTGKSKARTSTGDVQDGSESEMSVLLDDAPAPKKRKRGNSGSAATPKKPGKAKASKSKDDANLDPQEAEIKRLQSWLLKCGIRKLWHRELASYNSSKAKINHLKQMLQDVGLEGRFSVEKANRIKEARELQAEVEAVQASAKRWGKEKGSDEDDEDGVDEDEEEDEDEKAVPKPLLARNRGAAYDFLGSDDGEETD